VTSPTSSVVTACPSLLYKVNIELFLRFLISY